jgi:TonB family protein
MSTTLVWSNILAYSLQVGLLVAVAAFVPALVRMRAAGARLLYWQLLLAACLLLPWVRPWHREVIAASVSVTTVVTSVAIPATEPARIHIAPGELLLYLLAAGVLARLVWLGAGFWRLRRYRRRAVPLENAGVWAEVLLSAEVSSPVTFGWRRPVILLPERFPQLSDAMQEAILCHENLHVERRDWLFTVAEELVRAALWFHPAIWWLLAEIQLAREQAVDSQVVRITQSRDPYVDALLEMAGARPELDLAPAPLFLRKRHLKQRVLEIVREATMSKTRWIAALAASVVFLAAACWLVTGAFPLSAAPQIVPDAPGVTVDLGGAQVINRPGIQYPEDAIVKGVQGTVVVQVVVDADGAVSGASSVSGAHELREAVMQSVFGWRFAKDWASGTRQVIVTFELQKDAAAHLQEERRAMLRDLYARQPNPLVNRVIESIIVRGLSEQAKADLLARLPVHVGDTLTEDVEVNVGMAVQEMHLGLVLKPDKDAVAIWIEPGSQFGYEEAGGTAGLALSVKPDGTELLLTWNKDCEAIADATHGVLSISDGDRHEHYDMDANQLRTGSIVWAPVTGDVSFKLEVTGKNQTTTTESVRSLRTQPSPASAGNGTGHLPEATLRAFERIGSERLGFPLKGKVIKSIVVSGLSDQAKTDLLARLPAHVGDTLTEDVMINVDMALGKYDRRLGVAAYPDKDQVVMQIAPQGSPEFGVSPVGGSAGVQPALPAAGPGGDGTQRVRVGGNVQASQLISRVEPVYPPLAKQAKIQGTVELSVVIGKDGKVQDLRVIRGHPLLVQATLDAVKNWVYKPTLLNGEPVEVSTEISVNFTLEPSEGAPPHPSVISRVEPEYPEAAKQMRAQGPVVLEVSIGKDGAVEDIKVVSGHPLLVQPAKDALRKWVFSPKLVDGEPVDSKATIELNFRLPASENGETPTMRFDVNGNNAQGPSLISRVEPVYPPEAKQAGIHGQVDLQATIGKDGAVEDIKVLSGDPILAKAALDAVKKWRYSRTLVNGEPVETKTKITLTFAKHQ